MSQQYDKDNHPFLLQAFHISGCTQSLFFSISLAILFQFTFLSYFYFLISKYHSSSVFEPVFFFNPLSWLRQISIQHVQIYSSNFTACLAFPRWCPINISSFTYQNSDSPVILNFILPQSPLSWYIYFLWPHPWSVFSSLSSSSIQ